MPITMFGLYAAIALAVGALVFAVCAAFVRADECRGKLLYHPAQHPHESGAAEPVFGGGH